MINSIGVALFFDPCTAPSSPITPLVSGFLGAVVGAAASFGGIVYNQRRGTQALRRWIAQSHFDLFQDVADCAGEYDIKNNFGVFRERLSQQVRELRDGLSRDSTGGLRNDEFSSVYRSLSSVDYMIFVHDRQFRRQYMVGYVNKCLSEMRDAQSRFGPWPDFRPNAEIQLMKGEQQVLLENTPSGHQD